MGMALPIRKAVKSLQEDGKHCMEIVVTHTQQRHLQQRIFEQVRIE
jgi:hypothetical protein